ncbi:DUF2608 domain-containing protein [Chlamydia caviae]|uniref:Uncharacterized protein n=1 Tax=Chlamydia caviae (strain ATCC VR-813 / DSM 19441 / 03DC25 / GPIC) TaxID=227941 RepID=Q822F5_CHLCV|nr:DUF2608 domain-containing protein [Chlamydia caviae]AAP05469.1 conserved hypothetical protein [Chlamydia caviae GPIC]
MQKYWLFFFFLFPLALYSETTRYVEVKSIHEIAGDILYDSSDFWLIFDLDDTLLEGAEALSQSLWLQKTMEGFQQLGLSESEAWEAIYPYWEGFQEKGSVKTIENAMQLLITKIQEQKKTLFAYTERKLSSKDITLQQLKSLELKLDSTAPAVPNHLPKGILFTSGVLFGDELHKGPGLQLFLDAIGTLPEKIIYIDNRNENVLRIGELCKSKKISYLGVTYTAQKFLPPIYIPEISKVQYTYSQKLLSNEAAALLLRHQMTE